MVAEITGALETWTSLKLLHQGLGGENNTKKAESWSIGETCQLWEKHENSACSRKRHKTDWLEERQCCLITVGKNPSSISGLVVAPFINIWFGEGWLCKMVLVTGLRVGL